MPAFRRRRTAWPRRVAVRGVDLYVDKVGRGEPLVLMHGGPSADLWTMGAFRRCADQATLIFYDHRCNGRSTGVPVSSMTWDNLTADADALRSYLGFDKWALLGHSFGGQVALEYCLRYPDRVSRLVLLDTGAESRWARENAPRVAAQRGYGAAKAELVRRWFAGEFMPREYFSIFWRISPAYVSGSGWRMLARELADGAWRTRIRPQALIFAGRELLVDWSVVDRLREIHTPTLVIAGQDDFVFPPQCQHELAEGITGAQLALVENAGHSPQDERPDVVLSAVREFLAGRTLSCPDSLQPERPGLSPS